MGTISSRFSVLSPNGSSHSCDLRPVRPSPVKLARCSIALIRTTMGRSQAANGLLRASRPDRAHIDNDLKEQVVEPLAVSIMVIVHFKCHHYLHCWLEMLLGTTNKQPRQRLCDMVQRWLKV
nr:hypothetical protein CFP56_39008 [Quercus suber]